MARARMAAVLALCLAGISTGARVSHAGMRWGLALGSRFGRFAEAPDPNGLVAPPNENRTRTAWDAGLIAEWPAGRRLAFGAGLGFAESRAGRHQFTGVTVNRASGETGLWEDLTLRLRCISFTPRASVRFGPGFRVEFGPELDYLVNAERASALSETPIQAQLQALQSQGQIFEQFGGTTDVTGQYARWLPGLSIGAGWEYAVHAERLRLEGTYGELFAQPDAGSANGGRIRTLRLGLAWLH